MIQKPYNIIVNGQAVNGNTIDGKLSNVFTWSSSGGISTAFQVQIYNNSNNQLLFSSGVVTTYALAYTMPPNSILNGLQLQVTITAYDGLGNSATSNYQIFQTSSTPVVTLAALPNPIPSQNYTFSATYSQAENVPMASYIVYLYDANNNLLGQSSVLSAPPLQYTFEGLQSATSYQVEIEATSNLNMTGSTGLVAFTVEFTQPVANAVFTATSDDDAGSIQLSWSVYQLIGSTDIVGNINYVNNDSVNLTGGNNIWWNNGLSITDDFTLKMWIADPVVNENLLTFTGSNGTITLLIKSDFRFHVYKVLSNSTKTTHIVTEAIEGEFYFMSPNFFTYAVPANSKYFIVLQQIQNNMNISVEVLS